MDTKVQGAVLQVRDFGGFEESQVTLWETGKEPVIVPAEGMRVSLLRFNVDKKTNTKRENMAVQVKAFDADEFTGVEGHKLLNALIVDFQDSLVKRVADKELSIDVVNDQSKLIAEYFDTSRSSSGRKVTSEVIEKWFIDNCGELVAAKWLAKNPQGTDEVCQRFVKNFGTMFGKLTKYGLAGTFTPTQITMMENIVKECAAEANDEIRVWIEARFKKYATDRTEQDNLCDAI
jgi:hypothetical protein